MAQLEAEVTNSISLRKVWHQRWKAAKAVSDQAKLDTSAQRLEQCLATLKQVVELASFDVAASANAGSEASVKQSPHNNSNLSPARFHDPAIALHRAFDL